MANNKRKPVERAKTYGFDAEHVALLGGITAWFNNYGIDGELSIGTHWEPSISKLASIFGTWDEAHQQAFRDLQTADMVKTEDQYCAGRRCRWLPTQDCMDVIEHIFHDYEDLYAPFAERTHTGPPTYRDGSELMEHRKGTFVVAESLRRLSVVDSVDIYPYLPEEGERPDVKFWGDDGLLARVEVITKQNNKRESWQRKFQQWSAKNELSTIWLFSNRTTQVQFWNHLQRELNSFELDNGLFGGDPDNWSSTRVNDRINRSYDGDYKSWSQDACWTIGGMLMADDDGLLDFVQSYTSIL